MGGVFFFMTLFGRNGAILNWQHKSWQKRSSLLIRKGKLPCGQLLQFWALQASIIQILCNPFTNTAIIIRSMNSCGPYRVKMACGHQAIVLCQRVAYFWNKLIKMAPLARSAVIDRNSAKLTNSDQHVAAWNFMALWCASFAERASAKHSIW